MADFLGCYNSFDLRAWYSSSDILPWFLISMSFSSSAILLFPPAEPRVAPLLGFWGGVPPGPRTELAGPERSCFRLSNPLFSVSPGFLNSHADATATIDAARAIQ